MPRAKKDNTVRARANKASTRATLTPLAPEDVVIPHLPIRRDMDGNETEWCDETLDWWDEIWASPMAGEWCEADVHGLYRVAVMVDQFWVNPTASRHAEIRQAQQAYGLTPYDRRRLEWTIETAESAKDRGEQRRRSAQMPQPSMDNDPRLHIAG